MTGPTGDVDIVEDRSLPTPDGRTIAWTECGDPLGRVLLRMPGTPGSRFALRADRTPWIERGLRVITTERPGFGASTAWPDRGFHGPADDVARILDELVIDDVALMGGSGGGPHVLAFAARHADRVQAASIVVGAAPMEEDEIGQMIDLNQRSSRLARTGDVEQLRALMEEQRAAILADPLATFRAIMATAPPEDQDVMSDHVWQQAFVRGVTESLRHGVDGWLHEALALEHAWDEIDVESIKTSITWWASDDDRNCPLSAAQRLFARLPNARMNIWTGGGHLSPYRREAEILDELLGRC